MSELDVLKAEQRAELAKVRLGAALATLKQRLSPRRLAQQVVTTTKEKAAAAAETGVGAVKARPGIIAGAAALIALFLARKPIVRAISRDKAETQTKPTRSPARPRKGKS